MGKKKSLKKKEKYTVNCSVTARNLRANDLGGIIFGCKHSTIGECYDKQLFGLPAAHFSYVRNVYPGLPLFLFNYSNRELHGIFEAASPGQHYIDSFAWTSGKPTCEKSELTPYPAQVKVRIQMLYKPLVEEQFMPIIADNYYDRNHFWFELDKGQTSKLISLFSSSPWEDANSGRRISHQKDAETLVNIEQEIIHSRPTSEQVSYSNAVKGMSVSQEPVQLQPTMQHSYSSVVKGMTASLFQQKNPLAFDAQTEAEESKSSGLDMNLPLSEVQSNLVSATSLFMDSALKNFETLKDVESKDWSDDALGCMKRNYETKDLTTLLKDLNVDDDARRNWEELADSEANTPSPDHESDTKSGPSCVAPSLDGERKLGVLCDESLADKENPLCRFPSDAVKEIVTGNDDYKEDTVSFIVKPEEMDKNCDLQSLVAKLVKETVQLKASQLKHIQTIRSLELDMVESKNEIQKLKAQCKVLESRSFPSVGCVEELEFQSNNDSHASHDESILLLGGFNGTSWLPDLDSYSLSRDSVKSLKPMRHVRIYSSAAMLNGDLYVFGGGNGNLWYDTVESYNLETNQWTIRPSLNEKKGSMGGVSINNKILAIGGGNGFESLSSVEMFDPDAGFWIPTCSMSHKRLAPAVAQINGIVYVAGGYDRNEYLNSVERFDPREHSWTRLASMNSRRGCHSLAVLNEKLYALGGYDGAGMAPIVEVFDPCIGLWTMGKPMNVSRGYCGAIVVGKSIYVIGGMGGNSQSEILDTVECYDGQGWEVTNQKAAGRRCSFFAFVL